MKKNGIASVLAKRSLIRRVAPWVVFVLLSACDSGVVSQVSSPADDESEQSGLLTSSTAFTDDTSEAQQTTAGSAEVADPIAADDGSMLRIMAVGDSITHGFGGATSYRKPLLGLLRSSGCEFTMVGSMLNNLPDTGFVSPHEAYSGHRTDSFLTGQQSSFGDNRGISESMFEFMPQLVLLNIGTNDMSQNREVDDVIANIDQIVALVFNAAPEAKVIVSTLVPFFKSADPQNSVNIRLELLSNALEAWYAQAAQSGVFLVDIRDGFTADMMLPDLIHPGVEGDALIADRFYDSIQRNNLCG